MSVKITGVDTLVDTLEQRYGKQHMQRISDKALIEGAEMFIGIVNQSIGTSGKYAHGHTVADTDYKGPMFVNNVRTVTIHWNGPHGSYRTIHLNEFGTVKNPNPPRKGAIARAMRQAESKYKQIVKRELEGGL